MKILVTSFLFFFLLPINFSCANAISKEKENIIWPYICFSPLYICEDDQLIDGVGYELLNFIQDKMPEYKHELRLTPIKRILSQAKAGEQQLFYGLYKTPEREKILHFSYPCRISFPISIVVRKEDLNACGGGGTVSLDAVLQNRSLKFLLMESVSFGKKLDGILQKYSSSENVTVIHDTTNMGTKSLQMLVNKRVDYILSLGSLQYDARNMQVQNEISYIPLKEHDQFNVGYITAPKNKWGREMIDKVNSILKQEATHDDFFQLFVPMVDESQIEYFRENFNRLIVEPILSNDKKSK